MKHNEERILYAMRLYELGLSPKYICGKFDICRQTFHRWKKQYFCMDLTKLGEITYLKKENTALKKIVADLSLARHMLRQD